MTIFSFLEQAAVTFPRVDLLDTERLLAHALNRNTAYVRAFAETVLSSSQISILQHQLAQRDQGVPLAYLVGTQAFWDMELYVNEHTLIPRPDTEILVEAVQSHFSPNDTLSILDLGTGTGAIAIALARLFPNASVQATDVSVDALKVAKRNADTWAPDRIRLTHSSWFEDVTGRFDIIVSNPPYIAEHDTHLNALKHEPKLALTSGKAGLDAIKHLIAKAPSYLNAKGGLFLEHGYDQGEAVRLLFDTTTWQVSTTRQDYGGNDRVTFAHID